MKRPAGDHDNSLEDIRNDSEKRPRMEQDQIGRHQAYPFRPEHRPFVLPDDNGVAGPSPLTPPVQHCDLYNNPDDAAHGMDVPMSKTINNLRNHLPLSPATSRSSTPVSEDVFSITHSNLDSPPRSPITDSGEDYLPSRLRNSFTDCTLQSPRPISSQTCSESPPCFLSPEYYQDPPFFEPTLTSVYADKSNFLSHMDIRFASMSFDIEPRDAPVGFEQQRLAMENSFLPDPQERALSWIMSHYTTDMSSHGPLERFPGYHTEGDYPEIEITWEDTSSSYVDCDPILPEVGIKKSSKSQTMYTAMEIDPYGFGMSSFNIARLPEWVRAMIMSFCTEPKDLITLIKSSPVFLQPFCRNRRAIVSQVIKGMSFRFGGDMPHSCLMAARLHNMESKGAEDSPEVLKATAKRTIKSILRLPPKGALLHPLYSLRLLMFISDTLDKAEIVMTSYAHQAWTNKTGVKKLGPSHTTGNLVLSQTERKRFMDAICLYDAYCIAFFSENANSSHDDTTLRQSFLEDDGVPGEIIKRFYSITLYLYHFYHYWISIAIMKKHYDLSAKGEDPSLFLPSKKHIGQLVNHFVCSGPSVFRMLQDMGAPGRYDFILKLLDRCETDAEYLQKITSTQSRGDKQIWAYREMADLNQQAVRTAQHFWDPVLVRSMKMACHRWPATELQLRSRPDA
ncbi:hypothetical protein FOPG_11771 [Fusarium oxysporum f. sp. conglutinans race 2 54008]|uniref:Uncharacterized protein n=3 Tax=Fusarium oxysporum f. sp. conglutinans TaxID=100902 RepID=A0A8H6GVJ3_FUSOX|nr:hypothetical protein FOXB_06784 [Fusarium oxysporum f. sp. conglutinans Fo5176]EXL72717.1 hypothetical protein FOPG_11771 [Fusarium oxysporum f. sp. conglutinans race 2 54008]KAF6524934.1 hypothetical protein HZS61_010729 [Fusarium oxysporum f. sp. conglutinans]KAG6997455.1 hypothetical protein FocnCong_v016074 [Fusarium oxysporum f. sp. conglutinans]KAI8412069.1 hypothetical protein FOFC_08692 [Fusarium oxysporum]